MTPEETELITEFGKISKLMPNVLFDFIMGTLTPDRQREFGEILIVLGELLVNHAEDREQLAQPTTVEALDNRAKQVVVRTEQLPGEPSPTVRED